MYTMYIERVMGMPLAEFATVADARAGIKDMLDAAQVGGAGLINRDGRRYAVVAAEALRPILLRSVDVVPEVCFEDGGVGLALPGTPFATEGHDVATAAEDMVTALREYAQDWERLRSAPNHSRNAALVMLVETCTDDQLTAWLTGEETA